MLLSISTYLCCSVYTEQFPCLFPSGLTSPRIRKSELLPQPLGPHTSTFMPAFTCTRTKTPWTTHPNSHEHVHTCLHPQGNKDTVNNTHTCTGRKIHSEEHAHLHGRKDTQWTTHAPARSYLPSPAQEHTSTVNNMCPNTHRHVHTCLHLHKNKDTVNNMCPYAHQHVHVQAPYLHGNKDSEHVP